MGWWIIPQTCTPDFMGLKITVLPSPPNAPPSGNHKVQPSINECGICLNCHLTNISRTQVQASTSGPGKTDQMSNRVIPLLRTSALRFVHSCLTDVCLQQRGGVGHRFFSNVSQSASNSSFIFSQDIHLIGLALLVTIGEVSL